MKMKEVLENIDVTMQQLKKENDTLKSQIEYLKQLLYVKNCYPSEIPNLLDELDSLKLENENLNKCKLYSTKEWNDLRDQNEQLKADSAKYWDMYRHLSAEYAKYWDMYHKLDTEIKSLNDTIDYLKTERKISAKCNHYMLGQRERLEVENKQLKDKLQKYESNEPQYCDVSGVKLDKKVPCPMCCGERTLGQCRVCFGSGMVWDR